MVGVSAADSLRLRLFGRFALRVLSLEARFLAAGCLCCPCDDFLECCTDFLDDEIGLLLKALLRLIDEVFLAV